MINVIPLCIGGNIQPKRDLTRFVRWPKYVRLQRQRRILYQRLKVPPTIAQFTQTLDRQNGKGLRTCRHSVNAHVHTLVLHFYYSLTVSLSLSLSLPLSLPLPLFLSPQLPSCSVFCTSIVPRPELRRRQDFAHWRRRRPKAVTQLQRRSQSR